MTSDMRNSVVRLAIDMQPENIHLEAFREELGREMLRVDIEPAQEQPFRANIALQAMPDLAVASAEHSTCHMARPPNLVRQDNREEIGLIVLLEGKAIATDHRGHERQFQAGQAVFLNQSEATAVDYAAASRYFVLTCPRRMLLQRFGGIDNLCKAVLPANSDAARLLLHYGAFLLDDRRPPLLSETSQLLAGHFHDLAILLAGGAANGPEEPGGVRAARLSALKSDITANLGDCSLSRTSLALRHGITPRYVGKLFASEGASFSDYLYEQRLLHAYRLLCDSRQAYRSISAIALASGFSDISYFNRCFRRHFGATPSDIRAAAGEAKS